MKLENIKTVIEELKKWDGLRTYSESYQTGYEEALSDLLEELNKTPEERACPCLYGQPCHPDCTCVNPASSRGCEYCCSYGSKEQRAAAAQQIKDALMFASEDFHELTKLADQNRCDGHCDDKPPYHPCDECAATHAINEAGEVLSTALFMINKRKKNNG